MTYDEIQESWKRIDRAREERKKRLITAQMNGLSLKEAENSWYVNTPNAPKVLSGVLDKLLNALHGTS